MRGKLNGESREQRREEEEHRGWEEVLEVKVIEVRRKGSEWEGLNIQVGGALTRFCANTAEVSEVTPCGEVAGGWKNSVKPCAEAFWVMLLTSGGDLLRLWPKVSNAAEDDCLGHWELLRVISGGIIVSTGSGVNIAIWFTLLGRSAWIIWWGF